VNTNTNSPELRAPLKRRAILLLVLLLSATILIVHGFSIDRPHAFVEEWTQRFQAVESLAAALTFEETAPVVVRAFSSGEWLIATCEHSCCSGAGFDATVMRDSTGAIYADTTHTFCGIEGLSHELKELPGETLEAFYQHASQLKLRKQ
jgi:hypothetical protein